MLSHLLVSLQFRPAPDGLPHAEFAGIARTTTVMLCHSYVSLELARIFVTAFMAGIHEITLANRCLRARHICGLDKHPI